MLTQQCWLRLLSKTEDLADDKLSNYNRKAQANHPNLPFPQFYKAKAVTECLPVLLTSLHKSTSVNLFINP